MAPRKRRLEKLSDNETGVHDGLLTLITTTWTVWGGIYFRRGALVSSHVRKVSAVYVFDGVFERRFPTEMVALVKAAQMFMSTVNFRQKNLSAKRERIHFGPDSSRCKLRS